MKKLDAALWSLCALSTATILLANEDPFFRDQLCTAASVVCFRSNHAGAINKALYDLSAGSIISLLFYFLIVRLPDHQKRMRIKRSFQVQYVAFKEDCIEIFLLLADGSYQGGFPKTLLPQAAFRHYFKQNVSHGQVRWDRVADKLEGYYLQILLSRMETFREEIAFVLNNVDVGSDRAFEFLKQMSGAISSARVTAPGYDNKRLLGFLWSMFTGWDFVTGYPRNDIVEDTIAAI